MINKICYTKQLSYLFYCNYNLELDSGVSSVIISKLNKTIMSLVCNVFTKKLCGRSFSKSRCRRAVLTFIVVEKHFPFRLYIISMNHYASWRIMQHDTQRNSKNIDGYFSSLCKIYYEQIQRWILNRYLAVSEKQSMKCYNNSNQISPKRL